MNRLLAPSNYLSIGDKDTRFWEGGERGGAMRALTYAYLSLLFGLVAAPKKGVLLA